MSLSDSRVSFITPAHELSIPWQTLQTIIAGRSLIDTQELHIASSDEAQRFLQTYGMESDDEAEKLRYIALDYIAQAIQNDRDYRMHTGDDE